MKSILPGVLGCFRKGAIIASGISDGSGKWILFGNGVGMGFLGWERRVEHEGLARTNSAELVTSNQPRYDLFA